MATYAIVRSGGKQYLVKEGQVVSVEKTQTKDKTSIDLETLLIAKDGSVTIGKPVVEKAKVSAKVIEDFRDKKIRVVKYKSKSRYLRTTGHRQTKTKLQIEKITA